MCNVKIIK